MTQHEHEYDDKQNFNLVTRILHGVRFKNLINITKMITPAHGDRLRVLEIGCGMCRAYSVLDAELSIDYLGIELNEDYAAIAKQRYEGRENFEIRNDNIKNQLENIKDFDLIIGLESFEHIPEPLVVRVLEAVGKSNFQYLYLTVPNEVGPAIAIKNVGSFVMGYKRYQEYSWAETFRAAMYNLDKVGLHGTRHKGFDWRWLAQTIRQNCEIMEIYKSPANIVPRSVSPSIGFLARKRDQLQDW